MGKEGHATGDHEEASQYAVDLEEDMVEDDEDEVEEEEEGDEDEEDGVNALDSMKDGALGDQFYQQLIVGMDYEALAEKKRKAPVGNLADGSVKKVRQANGPGATIEEIMEDMESDYGMQGRPRKKDKKRGRRKGSKKKLPPELDHMLGDANLFYALGRFKEAIPILAEVVRQAPYVPDSYHSLALVHEVLGNKAAALNCLETALHLAPRDPSLLKLLSSRYNEQGNTSVALDYLLRAISVDPKEITVKLDAASLYVQLGDYQKAAALYEKIVQNRPDSDDDEGNKIYNEKNVEALKMGAKMYEKCGQRECAIHILEVYLRGHPTEADLSVIDLLASLYMENNAHNEALQHIEHAQLVFCSGKELPLEMKIKAGICHAYLGNMVKAGILFSVLQERSTNDRADLITEIADRTTEFNNGFHHLKIAHCYLSLNYRVESILYFYEALKTHENNIEARLTLASILLEETREDEAISLLSPPKNPDCFDLQTDKPEPWWCNGQVKLKLCHIYRVKGMHKEFVDAIYHLILESLRSASLRKKVKGTKRLSKRELLERVKVLELDDNQTDNLVFRHRPPPGASVSDLRKANRAKKSLQKKAKLKEEKRAEAMAAVAAGVHWKSDNDLDSDSDSDVYHPPQEIHRKEPPLPDLLKNKEHHRLIIDLCKSLTSLNRYREALEIIGLGLGLKSTHNMSSFKKELRSLGAQVAYSTPDPKHGFNCVKYIADQHPHSYTAWNCYYKVFTRLDEWYRGKHYKFVHGRRKDKFKDCAPPSVISGHHFTRNGRHQDAVREYLKAYKLFPENPLINLCVGTALINLALGGRIENKHQCVAQGLSFLYNNLRLCDNNQEALYNIARAFHQVGLVTLAASYYEKVLQTHEKDYLIPQLLHEHSDSVENGLPGYCDLRREAAFNLHHIYKQSGAVDLAQMVLRDHCTF